MLQQSPRGRKRLRTAMLQTGIMATILLAGIVYLQSCKQQDSTLKTPAATPIALDTAKVNAAKIASQSQADTSGVYAFADKMPEPSYSINDYLVKNLRYPAADRNKGIGGRVIVRFTVDESGHIVNPNVLRGVDPDLDAEALRVIAAMPPWTPGEQNGKKVAVYFTQPISFAAN